jgi:hypothetical protein
VYGTSVENQLDLLDADPLLTLTDAGQFLGYKNLIKPTYVHVFML